MNLTEPVRRFSRIGIGNSFFFAVVKIFFRKKAGKPRTVRIESTNLCNGKCVFCPHGKQTRKKGVMSMQLFNKIIRECSDLGIGEVHFQNFGEPLFDKNLFRKIRKAKDLGIKKTVIFSNASLFNGENIKKMIDSGLDEIYISFEGYNKKIFEKLRPGLKFDTVAENIKKIKQEKDRRGVDHPKVIINIVKMKEYEGKENEFRKKWGIYADEINFQNMHNWAEGRISVDRKPVCNTFWNYMTITWDGNALSCCLDWDGLYSLGNVKENSLMEIWNGKKYMAIRDMTLKGRIREIPLCRDCSLLNFDNNYSDMIKLFFLNFLGRK